jgi:ABC-2 type transport system ATP-binding protein
VPALLVTAGFAMVRPETMLLLASTLGAWLLLDPVQRRRMITLFQRLGSEGRCVLVSSHVLDEVARLGSRVLVIAQGRLVATGDYRDLRELMDDRPLRIRLRVSDVRRFATALVDRGLITAVSLEPEQLVVETLDIDSLGRSLAPLAVELGVRLTEVSPLDDDLESVFRYLVEGR